jgi:hypothetical protein
VAGAGDAQRAEAIADAFHNVPRLLCGKDTSGDGPLRASATCSSQG